jgi:hypothetical protein
MIITDEKNAYSARSLGEECSGQASGRAACAVIGVPYPVCRESNVISSRSLARSSDLRRLAEDVVLDAPAGQPMAMIDQS